MSEPTTVLELPKWNRDRLLLWSLTGQAANVTDIRNGAPRSDPHEHELHITFKYLYSHVVDDLWEYGFRVKDIVTESHVDGATFKATVIRYREPVADEYETIDLDLDVWAMPDTIQWIGTETHARVV